MIKPQRLISKKCIVEMAIIYENGYNSLHISLG